MRSDIVIVWFVELTLIVSSSSLVVDPEDEEEEDMASKIVSSGSSNNSVKNIELIKQGEKVLLLPIYKNYLANI